MEAVLKVNRRENRIDIDVRSNHRIRIESIESGDGSNVLYWSPRSSGSPG